MRKLGIITQNKKMFGFVDLTQCLLAIVVCLTLLGSLVLVGVRPATASEIINAELTLDNIDVDYDGGTDCGNTNSGTFTISATFTNNGTSSRNLSDLIFVVTTLGGGNMLCNADGGPGGVGSELSVLSTELGADEALNPGESFTQDLEVGLATTNPFAFWVNVKGEDKLYSLQGTGPGGGMVFYLTNGKKHGMEAATEADVLLKTWGCQGVEIAGAGGETVEGGSGNTEAIVNQCQETTSAARYAADYLVGIFTDWHLPSINALSELLFLEEDESGIHWSSTQVDAETARALDFYWLEDCFIDPGTDEEICIETPEMLDITEVKGAEYKARPVREF